MDRDPDYHLQVPAGFDDSEADSQVHPMARLLFSGTTNAEVFDRARQWVSEHNVFLVDTSWKYMYGEDEPLLLAIYFTFEEEPDDEPADETAN
ncbi:MAG TPA: hypothetical protein VG756_28030 [Pseudonocardiaceae bacterium]|jgi:hypothetical protein|nr:hypothetical protein [Pseudonocardiaceae bacterium]